MGRGMANIRASAAQFASKLAPTARPMGVGAAPDQVRGGRLAAMAALREDYCGCLMLKAPRTWPTE